MGCAMTLVKYLLFIFNFIFALSGLTLLVMGVMIYKKIEDYNEVGEFLGDKFSGPPIFLIAVGSVVFLVAFFGCCGAIRESHCMIVTFAILLLTIFVAEVAVGVVAFVYRDDIAAIGKDTMIQSFSKYTTDGEVRDTFDVLQRDLKCCGVDGPEDYYPVFNNNSLPATCCVKDNYERENEMCFYSTSSTLIHTKGCYTELKDFIKAVGLLLGSIAIGVAFIELVGVIFAFCLANSIKNEARRMGLTV